MRYDIRSWLGTGSNAEGDQYWRVWGRRRAQKVADEIVRGYRERGVANFEVCIFETRRDALKWFFSTDREREGASPLEDRTE